jgi:CheY-like chemotaxis protein
VGSTFWFTVTLAPALALTPVEHPPIDVTGARVLVIDDNPVNRMILLEQLTGWGFDACAACGGAEGIEVLNAVTHLGLEVDCLIVDYQMPEMSGIEVVTRLRAMPEHEDLSVVMLTSVDQSLGAKGFRDAQIDAQLVKPARGSVLLRTLVTMIQRRRRLRVAPPQAPRPPESRAPQTPTEERPPERVSPVPGRRLDVLVAEDNEVNQLVFTQILAETSLTFQIVANGRLAVEAYRDMRPGMVLMDVSMPEMNGLEATAAIRAIEAAADGVRTPIIGVTAHALRGDRERCLSAGMDDYLPKPISPKALQEKIDRWSRIAGEARPAAASGLS